MKEEPKQKPRKDNVDWLRRFLSGSCLARLIWNPSLLNQDGTIHHRLGPPTSIRTKSVQSLTDQSAVGSLTTETPPGNARLGQPGS